MRFEGPCYAPEHIVPIAGLRLAEQPHGRIPRTVVTTELPAPFRRARQQQPNRVAQGAGQVGQRGIDRDDQIHALCGKRGGAGIIEMGREIDGEWQLG